MTEKASTTPVPPVSSTPSAPTTPAARVPTSAPGSAWWRTAVAIVLGVLATLSVTVAVVGTWTRDLVLDTDRFLEVVGPVVSEPAVHDAIGEEVAQRVVAAIPEGALTEWLPDRVGAAAGSAGRALLESAVRDTTSRIVASDAVASVWVSANRVLHTQLSAVLRADPDALAVVDGDERLSLNLTGVWERASARLAEIGVPSRLLPEREVLVPVADGQAVLTAQRWTSVLVHVTGWSVLLAVVAAAGTVLLSRDRLRATAWLGGGIAVAMGALLVGISLARDPAVRAIGSDLGSSVTAVLYDRATASLGLAALVVLGVAALAVVAQVVSRIRRSGGRTR